MQQFYPGELGGLALAEVIFGDVNPSGAFLYHPSGPTPSSTDHCCRVSHLIVVVLYLIPRWLDAGKLPVSFPRSVGTTPVFYNYLKGARFVDAGQELDDGSLKFGHQVRPLLNV